jgi:osmotically-inducible protein OsmY
MVFANSCFAKTPTDTDIDTQIHLLYKKNPILNEKNVHSKTEKQKVILQGCVRNHSEKELAEDLAGLVDYIDRIDNKIEVKGHPKTPSKNASALPDQFSDAFISRLVHSKIFLDPSISCSNIQVTTLNRITILKGKVATLKQKKRAYEIAYKTKGVVDVVNKLKVTPV